MLTSGPLVSVIVTCFGSPNRLESALRSVFNQTYRNIEVLLVDDNEPDTKYRRDTEEIVQQILDAGYRLKYIKHERNMNGAVARNTGIAASSGSFLAFLDDDDEYLPNRISIFVDVISNASTNIAGVYSGCEFRRGDSTYLRYCSVESGRFLVETLACTFMFCTGSNIFVRREVVKELAGFDVNFIRHQDYEFLVRLFGKYSLCAVNEIHVIKNNDNVNRPDVHRMILIKDQYLKKYSEIIDSLPEKDKIYIFRKNHLEILEQAVVSRKWRTSLIYFRKVYSLGAFSASEYIRLTLLFARSFW